MPNLKRWKSSTAQVVSEGKSGSWGGALTKGEVRECELTKKMFFRSDFLQLRLSKNGRQLSSSLTPLFFMIKKLAFRTNEMKR